MENGRPLLEERINLVKLNLKEKHPDLTEDDLQYQDHVHHALFGRIERSQSRCTQRSFINF
ncbi:MAG: hypothetical protein AAF843_04605 [Bacteroidota bacterium]